MIFVFLFGIKIFNSVYSKVVKKPNQAAQDLHSKIMATMEKHKEVFFTIRLHSAQSAASLSAITDPDPQMSCDLMDGRDAFLTTAREKHLEFSSLRRCKYSTLAMVYELHTQVPIILVFCIQYLFKTQIWFGEFN